MPRQPDDPSGAKIPISIRLSPDQLTRLDALAERTGRSRNGAIASLIDRATKPKEPADPTPETVTATPEAPCEHRWSAVKGQPTTCILCGDTP